MNTLFRFDDETGELHNPRIDRNALRHLFAKKAELEKREKEQRETIQQLHRHKCRYLCLDPETTPLFPQFPEYFYNPERGEWYKLPPFQPEKEAAPENGDGENPDLNLPSFHPKNYPQMANMPYEAFRETDEPLPDPAKIYPPGVVAISYFFGPPMSLDPKYAEISERKRKEQDSMPITFIDPESGIELPIPELSTTEYLEASAKRRKLLAPQRAPSLEEEDEDYDSRLMEAVYNNQTGNGASAALTSSNNNVFMSFLNGEADKTVEEDIRNLLDIASIPLPTVEQPKVRLNLNSLLT